MKCDVIIPVGPGHEEIVNIAITSVNLAARFSFGPFDDIGIHAQDDTQGAYGRSKARNLAAQESSADWLYYLDADDVVTTELFASINPRDIDNYDAIWGKFGELHGGLIHERYQTWGFDTYEDLLRISKHFSIKMGHFVRRDVALEFPFAEKMNVGEDWEYYLRIWRNKRCIKVGGPVVYLKTRGQHSTGPKSATGAQWTESVGAQIRLARHKLND